MTLDLPTILKRAEALQAIQPSKIHYFDAVRQITYDALVISSDLRDALATDIPILCNEVAALRSDNEAKGKEIEELKVSVEDWKKIGKAHIVHLKEDEFRTRLKGVWEEAAKILTTERGLTREGVIEIFRSRSATPLPADAGPPTPSTPSQKDDV